MASHDLINTKPTILRATLGAIPAIAANPPELESSIRGGLRGGGSIFLCIDLGESFPFAAVQQAILKSTGNRDRPFGILLMNVCVCPECAFRWSDSLVCLPKGCLLFSGALSLFFAWTNGQVL